MHNGEKIRIIRNLRNLTQSQLADKINLTRASVSYIERTGKVNYFTQIRILKVLKISEEDFENLDPQIILDLQSGKNEGLEKDQLRILQDKLAHYQKENETLQKLVEAQQMIIDSYKKKGATKAK